MNRLASARAGLAAAAAVCLAAAGGTPSPAYTRAGTGSGAAPIWLSWKVDPISYLINEQTSDALANVAAGSDPVTAVRRAFQNWQDVAEADVSASYAGTTAIDAAAFDGSNVISFVDTSYPYNGALAVAQFWYSTSTGEILEADLVFNPAIQWSSRAGTPGVFDIEAVATHEVGHLLGLAHSASLPATMYPYAEDGSQRERHLDSDDRAGLAAIYPAPGVTRGAVAGTVTAAGTALFGAHVVAIDTGSGRPVATALTTASGAYEISGLPAGTYLLVAEPLDRPVQQGNFGGYWSTAAFDTAFRTTFHGGNDAPTAVAVAGGTTTTGIDIDAAAGAPSINPRMIGRRPAAGGGFSVRSTPTTMRQGEGGAWNLVVAGEGLAAPATFTVLGVGVVRISAVSYGTFGSGLPYLEATVSVAADASPAPRVVRIDRNGETAVLTGALEVLDDEPPLAFRPDPLDPTSLLIEWYGPTGVYRLLRDTQPDFSAAAPILDGADTHYSDSGAWTDGAIYFYRLVPPP